MNTNENYNGYDLERTDAQRVMVLTLIMTVVFLIGFWFIAGTIGQSSMSHGSSFPSGEELLIRFTNGLFILSFGFFFGAFVIAF